MSQVELDPRNQEAIQAALDGGWEKAALLNASLFEDYPDDIDIINRLAKAYTELGQTNKAKATYEKVLEVDPYNPIAMRNLDRISTLRGTVKANDNSVRPIDPDIFLEVPGKTKTIEVTDLAMPTVLVNLRVGDSVDLKANKNDVTVVDANGHRLGKLDEAWGQEISQATSLGSEFNAVVKAVQVSKNTKNTLLTVFVRETKRSKKLANPLFPIDNNFTPYVRESSLSYLKNNEELTTETSDEETPIEVEDLPEDEFSEAPSKTSVIEDEEDFSPQ